jgi:putative hemolysin
MWTSIGLVILFVLIGGLFSGTEFALVSLRESQIDQLAEEGPSGRRVAKMLRDPNRFLAAVQLIATLASMASAAYGASTLAPLLAPYVERFGVSEGVATSVTLIVLTLIIAYLAMVLGELVPKRLALQWSEKWSLLLGPLLDRFANLARPVIWLLSKSTNAVVRLLGGDPDARADEVDEEELRVLIAGQDQLDDDERRILTDVLAAGDRTIVEAMTPRGKVLFLPASLTLTEAAERTRDLPYSRYPVIGRSFDDVLGFVHVRDILQPPRDSDPDVVRIHAVKRPITMLPGTNRAIESMSQMRKTGAQIAIVVDEYGGTDGIVTLEDVVEELVGDIRDEYDAPLVVHAAGTYDAGLTIEEFARASAVELEDGPYETVAGYVVARLGRLGEVGDVIVLDGSTTPEKDDDDGDPEHAVTLTVADVEGRRIRTVSLS